MKNSGKLNGRKFLSLILAISLVIGLLPTMVFATTMNGMLYVNGVEVTASNCSDVLSNGTVSYDIATSTLTLDDAFINMGYRSAVYQIYYDSGIYIRDIPEVTIKLVGKNTILHKTTPSHYHGIYFDGDVLNITGDGELIVTTPNNCSYYGIRSSGTLNMDSGDVTVKTGEQTSKSNVSDSSVAVFTNGINVSGDANLRVIAGSVSKVSHKPINALTSNKGLRISDQAYVFLAGGSANAETTKEAGIGLNIAGDVVQTGGTLVVESGTGNPAIESRAIWFKRGYDDYLLTNGILDATGNICASNRNITTSQADIVTVKAGPTEKTATIVDASSSYEKNAYVHVEATKIDYWTLTFENNGGTGTMPEVHVPWDSTEKFELPENGFTPPAGKKFWMWVVDDSASSKYYAGSLLTVDRNATIKPEWVNTTSNITFDPNGGSGVQEGFLARPGTGYNVPKTTTFTPPAGKQLKGWSKTSDGSDGLLEYISGYEDDVIYAIWEDIQHPTITPTAGPNGAISPNHSLVLSSGNNLTFTFTPDEGYVTDEVTVNDTKVAVTDNRYTMTDVTEDKKIHVTFKEASLTPYVLTVIDGTGSGDYREGTVVDIAAEAPTGKRFKNWTSSDGGTFADFTDEATTFTMPANDTAVTPIYEDIPIETTIKFDDVNPSDWFHFYVYDVVGCGLFAGTSDTTFSPHDNATRAMVWTVLARGAGEDVAGGNPWYAKAQHWSIYKGVSDGTDPDNFITREQFVTMIYRLFESPKGTGTLHFADADNVSSWAYDALVWAVENSVISGKGGNTLDPQGNLTRAEMAAILSRLINAE